MGACPWNTHNRSLSRWYSMVSNLQWCLNSCCEACDSASAHWSANFDDIKNRIHQNSIAFKNSTNHQISDIEEKLKTSQSFRFIVDIEKRHEEGNLINATYLEQLVIKLGKARPIS